MLNFVKRSITCLLILELDNGLKGEDSLFLMMIQGLVLIPDPAVKQNQELSHLSGLLWSTEKQEEWQDMANNHV